MEKKGGGGCIGVVDCGLKVNVHTIHPKVVSPHFMSLAIVESLSSSSKRCVFLLL